MKKPTPADIKESLALGKYFFSRQTLKFFGQTMKSFKTEWSDKENGIVRIYARHKHGMTERFIKITESGDLIEYID